MFINKWIGYDFEVINGGLMMLLNLEGRFLIIGSGFFAG